MKVPTVERTQRGKDGIFWVRYSFNGKREHYSLGTTDEVEARDKVERIQYEIKYGKHRPINKMIFDNLLEQFLEAQKTYNAECSYTRDLTSSKPLLKAFGGRRIDDLTHHDLELYMTKRLNGELNTAESRKKNPSKSTINHEVVMIKHMFNKAVEWGLLPTNHLRQVRLFSLPAFRPRYITLEELVKLHRHSSAEMWDIMAFNLSTGMRPKEIFNLKWSDVDWPQRQLTILDAKNRTPRMIPLNDVVYFMFLRRHQHLASDYVFPGKDGKKRTTVRTAFKAACRRAGITNLRFYDVRKSFITWLVTEGIDIRTVQGLSGHKRLESLEHYLAFRSDKKRPAVDVISKLLSEIGPKSGPNSEQSE